MLVLKISLRKEEIEELVSKRKRLSLNIPKTANILNCSVKNLSNAQKGKFVPSEVFNSIESWIALG